MKIRVIKNAFYNLEYLKASEGKIIDFKGDKVPSWGEKVKGDKKTENKTPEANKTPEGNADDKNDGKKDEQIKEPEDEQKDENNKTPENETLTEGEKAQYLELLINEAIDKNIVIEDADKKTVDEQIAELEIKLGKGK